MDTMLSGLDFAVAYLDDILLKSKNPEERKKKCFPGFQKDSGLLIQAERWKCEVFMNKIKYLEQIIDENGRKPDPARSSAIKDIPALENVCSQQSFLGLANHYNLLVPKMHCLRASLNKQLKKDTKLVWSTTCKEAFEKIIGMLQSGLFLTHYDPKKK